MPTIPSVFLKASWIFIFRGNIDRRFRGFEASLFRWNGRKTRNKTLREFLDVTFFPVKSRAERKVDTSWKSLKYPRSVKNARRCQQAVNTCYLTGEKDWIVKGVRYLVPFLITRREMGCDHCSQWTSGVTQVYNGGQNAISSSKSHRHDVNISIDDE